MKVILSRKGFDSSAGGYPSPHLIDSGRLISLPIPEDERVNSGLTYSDLWVSRNQTYLNLMDQLGISKYSHGTFAHLDPDIHSAVIPRSDSCWRGIFGQSGAAQAHLSGKNVQVGDLFLFFGWFRDAIKDGSNYKFIRGTDKHIVWGYMQVGEIEAIDMARQYESWKQNHPHYRCRDREMNTAYIASTTLSFNHSVPGYGTFSYEQSLVLTQIGQRKRSLWKLPRFFHPSYGTKISYHEKMISNSGKSIWELHDDHCVLSTVGRGQEFVIEGNDEIVKWAKELILNQSLR